MTLKLVFIDYSFFARIEGRRQCGTTTNTLKLGEAELSTAYVKSVGWVSKIPV